MNSPAFENTSLAFEELVAYFRRTSSVKLNLLLLKIISEALTASAAFQEIIYQSLSFMSRKGMCIVSENSIFHLSNLLLIYLFNFQ